MLARRAAQADVGAQAHDRPVACRRTACGFRKRTTSPTCTSTNLRRAHCCAGGSRGSARRGCASRAGGVDGVAQSLGLARARPPASRHQRLAYRMVRLALTMAPPPSAVDARAAPRLPGRPPGRRRRAAESAPRAPRARTARDISRVGGADHQAERAVPVPGQARGGRRAGTAARRSTSRSWISPAPGLTGLAQHEHAAVAVLEEWLERVARPGTG